ncbi:CatB-related O-acetyltransferase [Schleiferiaceae bacterium]|nr:CatB-related O-acetyltransferase [Schleiferiaceae bacterium]
MNNDSKIAFLIDALIRGHDNFDQIYKYLDAILDAKSLQLNSDELYDKLRENIAEKVRLSGESLKSIEYHKRFGWVIESKDNSAAYLGKINLTGNSTLDIGKMSYFSGSSTINGRDSLKIGSFCSLATGIEIFTSNINHPMNFLSTYNMVSNARILERDDKVELPNFRQQIVELEKRRDVVIGNDVWIGRDVLIMNGIVIGDGCIVGARSTVTSNCEPYGVYVGTPAKLIKYRFPREVIDQLIGIQWWKWSIEKIKKNRMLFDVELSKYSGDLNKLINDI